MAIDIGAAAIDRVASWDATYATVNKENPASADGTLDTVEIWANVTINGAEAATFYVVSGNYLSTRDYESLGSVTAGSKQIFTGLSIDTMTGDYLGAQGTSGSFEYDTSGGVGLWSRGYGDYIPCTNLNFSSNSTYTLSLYGTGTGGGGATEKQSSDSGSGADSLPAREIALPDSGSGVDAFVSLQTPAAKTASDTGAGVDALVSLQVPVAKTSSDNGSGVEAVPIPGAVLAGNEAGAGVEAFIARLLAAAETGYGAEASEIGGGGLLKHLFASELGEGADALTAKIEKPTKGGGMRLWT